MALLGTAALLCRAISCHRAAVAAQAWPYKPLAVSCRAAEHAGRRAAVLLCRRQPLVITTNVLPPWFATARKSSSCAVAPTPPTPPQDATLPQGRVVDTPLLRDAVSPRGRAVDTMPQQGHDLGRTSSPVH